MACGQCWQTAIQREYEQYLTDQGWIRPAGLPEEPADPRLTLAEAARPRFQPPRPAREPWNRPASSGVPDEEDHGDDPLDGLVNPMDER